MLRGAHLLYCSSFLFPRNRHLKRVENGAQRGSIASSNKRSHVIGMTLVCSDQLADNVSDGDHSQDLVGGRVDDGNVSNPSFGHEFHTIVQRGGGGDTGKRFCAHNFPDQGGLGGSSPDNDLVEIIGLGDDADGSFLFTLDDDEAADVVIDHFFDGVVDESVTVGVIEFLTLCFENVLDGA